MFSVYVIPPHFEGASPALIEQEIIRAVVPVACVQEQQYILRYVLSTHIAPLQAALLSGPEAVLERFRGRVDAIRRHQPESNYSSNWTPFASSRIVRKPGIAVEVDWSLHPIRRPDWVWVGQVLKTHGVWA